MLYPQPTGQKFVGDQIIRRRHGAHRQYGDLGIVRVASCQQEDAQAASLVAGGMELDGRAPFGDADTKSQGSLWRYWQRNGPPGAQMNHIPTRL